MQIAAPRVRYTKVGLSARVHEAKGAFERGARRRREKKGEKEEEKEKKKSAVCGSICTRMRGGVFEGGS